MVQSFGGPWTEQKLAVIRAYLRAYARALKNKPFRLTYVDAFAGEGEWRPRSVDGVMQDIREGSARIALGIEDRPFDRLILIEQDSNRCARLETLKEENPARRIVVLNDDANRAIPSLCGNLEWNDRIVVFLDPFDTAVNWDTIEALAKTRKADCWILFPLITIARYMPRENAPTPQLQSKLDVVFGGRPHWEHPIYPSAQLSLFGQADPIRDRGVSKISSAFRERLAEVFVDVAQTRGILRNRKGSPMFELFFAASNKTGAPLAIRIANNLLAGLTS